MTTEEGQLLEQALLAAPEDLSGWAVYADHLQACGDPWGERVSLGLAHGESLGQRHRELHDALVDYDRTHAVRLLGEPLARLLDEPGFANVLVLERAFGLMIGARIGRTWIVNEKSKSNAVDLDYAARVLAALLAGNATRLLRSLALGYCELRKALASIAASPRAAQLRRFTLGWELRRASGHVERMSPLGTLTPLLARMPALHELGLAGASEGFDHPGVARLELTIETSDATLPETLLHARLPSLRALALHCRPDTIQSPNSIAEAALLELFARLARIGGGIEQLELVHWRVAEGRRPLLGALARAEVPTLRRLVLRELGEDVGALQMLADEAPAFARLERVAIDRAPDGRLATRLREAYGERLIWPEA